MGDSERPRDFSNGTNGPVTPTMAQSCADSGKRMPAERAAEPARRHRFRVRLLGRHVSLTAPLSASSALATVGTVRIDNEVRELLAGGVATIVASRDEELRPCIARGWGIVASPDGTEMTLCVAAPAGSRMRSNLESNAAIAVTCSQPTTYRGVQLKGVVVATFQPTRLATRVPRRIRATASNSPIPRLRRPRLTRHEDEHRAVLRSCHRR